MKPVYHALKKVWPWYIVNQFTVECSCGWHSEPFDYDITVWGLENIPKRLIQEHIWSTLIFNEYYYGFRII
jgi:hypothetical protein